MNQTKVKQRPKYPAEPGAHSKVSRVLFKKKIMHPVFFEGSVEIKKPTDMTDEQCISAWAKFGFDKLYKIIQSSGMMKIPPGLYAGTDQDGFAYYLTAWQPNKEDLEALIAGRPVYVKTLSKGLPPMALFTLDEKDGANF